jgi:hypothetical protein
MKLANAFAAAWKDLKAVAVKVSAALAKNSAGIQTVVADGSAVAIAIDPSIAPEVTAFDALEEVIIGKVAAAATDIANASSLSVLFGEAWPAIQALVKALENHPTVANVTAALGAAEKAI